jgi:hypothetical protein
VLNLEFIAEGGELLKAYYGLSHEDYNFHTALPSCVLLNFVTPDSPGDSLVLSWRHVTNLSMIVE